VTGDCIRHDEVEITDRPIARCGIAGGARQLFVANRCVICHRGHLKQPKDRGNGATPGPSRPHRPTGQETGTDKGTSAFPCRLLRSEISLS
jgi:hypothetical protein